MNSIFFIVNLVLTIKRYDCMLQMYNKFLAIANKFKQFVNLITYIMLT